MSIESAVRRLCEKGGVEADTLRVLAARNGVAWSSELPMDLTEMYDFLGTRSEASREEVERALKKLASDGLVSLENRKRTAGVSGEPAKDILVNVNDLRGLRLALTQDDIYRRYNYGRYTRVRDALERKGQA